MNNYITDKKYTKDKKRSAILLLSLIGIIIIDTYAFTIGGYAYGRYFAVLMVALAVFLNVESTYYLIVFCFPFASILKISSSSISILPFLYLILLLKLILVKKVHLNVIALIAIVIMTVTQLGYIMLYQASIDSIISVMLNIVFVMFSASYFMELEDKKNTMITTAAVLLLVSVALNIMISDLLPVLPYKINASKQYMLDIDSRFGALLLEPNELSQIILIAIGLFMAVYSSIGNKILRVALIGVAVYIGINGIRTNSKSYVLVILAMFLLLFLLYIRRVGKTQGAGAALVRLVPLLVVMAFATIYFYDNVIMAVFEERSSTGTDLLSNREDIWINYLTVLEERVDILLAGYGFGNVTKSLTLVGIETLVVPHNMYIEFVIQLGLGGIVLWAGSWFKVWQATFRKMNMFFVLPLLAFAVTSFAISANSNDCFYILMMLLSMPYVKRAGQDKLTKGDKADVKSIQTLETNHI